MSSDQVGIIQASAQNQANSYVSQMQQFLLALQQQTRTYIDVKLVQGSVDISASKNALSTLLTQAQTVPPDPLEPSPLPTISLPKPLEAEKSIDVGNYPKISVPDIKDTSPPKVDGADSSFDGVRPTYNKITPAVRPTITLPSVLQFQNIVLPTITDITIPQLTATAPTDDLTAPSNLFTYSENAYQSALLDSSKAKLLSDMVNGGYGIEPADENALWARARDRELQNVNAASMEVARQMAARGFSLPPGAMLAQLASTQQEGAEKISTVSRDIALKRADMYVENRKFTITEVRELEQLSINLHMSVMERALNAAKAVAEFGIGLYNARINKFNALMEGFKANVSAYEASVRGALGQLEAQKIKLQASQVEAEINKTRAEVYNIQVDGQKALIEMYRADVAALEAAVGVERLKLDEYRVDVEVYAEKIRAETLKLQAYEAGIRGNLARVDVYKAQIEAQMAQAKIVESQVSVVEANARIKVENLKSAVAVAVANADVYRAQTQGVAASNEAQARAFAARTEAFRAIAAVDESYGKLTISEFDQNTRLALENAKNSIDGLKSSANISLGAATAGAEVLSKSIQASLNQVIGIESAISNSA